MTQNPARFDIWSHDVSTGGQASPEGLAQFGEWIGNATEVTVGENSYNVQALLDDPEGVLNLMNFARPNNDCLAYVIPKTESENQATLYVSDQTVGFRTRDKFTVTI